MRVKEIEVNYGVTKNMGNYESLRLDQTIRVELDGNDTVKEAMAHARKTLREDVEDAIAEEVDWLNRPDKNPKPPRRLG